MENGETNEKLIIKKVASHMVGQKEALISRYPLEADKRWVEANEKEAVEWNFNDQNGRIYLSNGRLFKFFVHIKYKLNETKTEKTDECQKQSRFL
jgi:hypothetical protein